MKRDVVAYVVSGTFFWLLAGWIIVSQRSVPPPAQPPAPATSAASPAAPAFDAGRAAELERQAGAQPESAAVRRELADLYFDAERFDQAVPWYEATLKLDPKNADVSTNLALSYLATGQVQRSLTQIDRSLAIDPQNVKALFTQGVVRARGNKDLDGAAESWKRLVAVAPDSEEAKQAQMGLDAIQGAHAGVTGAARSSSGAPR